ncbi:hydroxyacylglutathione hydrolase [Geosmithia morbida]|uniref:hydroxyacylglutathione hydrolase n=1 Tax=Geosmithia morbida TaxID=1094350 RepID=A0A9P5CYP2_9HYPO|nr:hydroxyacylglutathione hydrolase [Geosmithia morbida]KAF4119612.1 hydroxyacylglutathione hydrolase [Geosmithia morbida]
MHIKSIPMFLKDAIQRGEINLKAIVNTHHHWDHAGGNNQMRKDLGLPKLRIIGGKDCQSVDEVPSHGETFKLGDVSVRSIHTPCHTQDSICYFMQDGDDKAVFTGDTLFIGGCGRFFEGTAEEMHEALNTRLAALPDDTVVYPGHEYTKANVKFCLSVLQSEPIKRLEAFAATNEVTTGKFTIGDEKAHNVFMRVEDPTILKATGEKEPGSVMAKLREMKNNFKSAPSTTGGAPGSSRPPPRSKLAREHNVSSQEEGEIKEAFGLFAEPMDGEKNGVLPIDDFKSALIALGIPASSNAELNEFISILDPDSDGYATYEPFFAICALKFHNRASADDEEAHRAEVEEAFRLFTNGQVGNGGGGGGGGGGGHGQTRGDNRITLAHLRRVAAVLKEDVDDEILKDMILEANGGAGVSRGVEMDEFDGVMKSAGVWR